MEFFILDITYKVSPRNQLQKAMAEYFNAFARRKFDHLEVKVWIDKVQRVLQDKQNIYFTCREIEVTILKPTTADTDYWIEFKHFAVLRFVWGHDDEKNDKTIRGITGFHQRRTRKTESKGSQIRKAQA
ncbi:MAG: hypothetical protein NXI00_11080 [Cytophagales bacterium]|nr:hypothetical protein [Cytophagales bacterium]